MEGGVGGAPGRNPPPTDLYPPRILVTAHAPRGVASAGDAERRTAMPTSNCGTWIEWLVAWGRAQLNGVACNCAVTLWLNAKATGGVRLRR